MSKIDVKKFRPELQSELERVGLFSAEKILLMSHEEFYEIGNFNTRDVNSLKDAAAKIICPGFRKVSSIEEYLNNKWKTITFDCLEIDQALGGGLPTRGITELSGESAAGKTQFCLQYCLTAQYPETEGGLGLKAVYICTEDRFPSSRLAQLTPHFPRNSSSSLDKSTHSFSDNIYVIHIATVENLMDCLDRGLPRLMESSRVGLVVVDSIAALFRSDYSLGQSVARARDLRRVGLRLHSTARRFGLALICVNQISDVVDGGGKIPSLGLAWANLVTTKLQLRLKSSNSGDMETRKRSFHVLSAPHLPPAAVPYRIQASGIVADTGV